MKKTYELVTPLSSYELKFTDEEVEKFRKDNPHFLLLRKDALQEIDGK